MDLMLANSNNGNQLRESEYLRILKEGIHMNIHITTSENEEITGNYIFEAKSKEEFYTKLGISLAANVFDKEELPKTGKITINWN